MKEELKRRLLELEEKYDELTKSVVDGYIRSGALDYVNNGIRSAKKQLRKIHQEELFNQWYNEIKLD